VAVERRHPDARAIIEIGGHDAKVVILERGAHRRQTVSMNDKCAGGTGVVIDKIAAKLHVPEQALCELAFEGRTIHPVAGKCGVFAETDINGLQKRGIPAEDLLISLFDAIVIQDLAGLARGLTLQPQVLLVGGPHAFITGLRDAWRSHLFRIWRERGLAVDEKAAGQLVFAPPYAAHLGALGAIDLGLQDRTSAGEYTGAARYAATLGSGAASAARRGAPAIAVTGLGMDAFRRQYAQTPWSPPPVPRGTVVDGFIGLDAGSTSTKAVVLSAEGEVLAKAYQLSRGNPIEDGVDMFRALRQQIEAHGARLDVLGLVTTGYAKDTLEEVFAADAALVETVAHARSALQLYDDPHVIVDVGGQDIKIVVLRDGRVKDFRLNTQCSAGNGYFLQAIAQTFGCPVEDFADAAFSASEMPVFGHGCVLFLQSEIADVQRRGWRPQEILAGLAAVLPKNVFLYVAKAPNLARLGSRFVLQGGTQRNLAAVKAQVDFIRESFRGQSREPDIVLHRHAGEAGAIGAALEGIRLWREGRKTTFVGLEAAEHVEYRAHSGEDTRCRYCRNECLRTFIDVWSGGAPDGGEAAARRLIVATCEKGSAPDVAAVQQMAAHTKDIKRRTPNLVADAALEAWKSPGCKPIVDGGRRAVERRNRIRIGIPRVLNMYAYAPLFAGYLESLGVLPSNIVYSSFTANDMYRAGSDRGCIDPCFPSKVGLAHVHDLLFAKHARRPLDAIFFPMVDVLPSHFVNAVASHACPTVTLTAQTVRAALTRETDLFAEKGVVYLDPLLDLSRRPLLRHQMHETWGGILDCSREESDRAIEAGFGALAAYEERIQRAARAALDLIEREDRVGIVLLGRPYHHDPGLNHGIPEELQKLGYVVFSQSTLPLDSDLLERLFGEEVRSGSVDDALDVNDVWKRSFSTSSNSKLWAAKFTARHPNLVAVELSNFKCGHDATIYSTLEEIVECSGTPFFAFRDVDENRPAGAIALRVETIDYSLRRWQERLAARRRASERVNRVLTRYERLLRARFAAPRQALDTHQVT
jgi:activator of 2-hydroxyglutaryl-CoA dehydratase/predicted nucleotide-binding protein (sugar kinase/HSP70/actin superfamily)